VRVVFLSFLKNILKCLFHLGVMVIINSQISLTAVTFKNNMIHKHDAFPNLRHNVYVTNGSTITVADLRPDTGASSFIYVADEEAAGGSVVSGVAAPLFVPRISSVSPSELSPGSSTRFVISGGGFYPCGMSLAVYKGGSNNRIVVSLLFWKCNMCYSFGFLIDRG
jgi:hypothetical protein